MQRIQIEVSKRDETIKPKVLRREGRLPAVFYGTGGDPVAVEVDAHQFSKLGLGGAGAHILNFTSTDSALNNGLALVRNIQTHPVSGKPIHVDFLRIDMSKPVDANVVLNFTGKAAGVVEGGMLQPLRRELQVRALPDRLPEAIEVDVTELNIHDSIHVEDLKLAEGVEAVFNENFTLVTVVPPITVEEPAAEELEEGEEGAAPAEGGEEASKEGAAEGDENKAG